MAFKKSFKRPGQDRFVKRSPAACSFCKSKIEPDYKDFLTLKKYMSERARILSYKNSGLCSKHQRKVAIAIKRARHLGLLPFTNEL